MMLVAVLLEVVVENLDAARGQEAGQMLEKGGEEEGVN
jgi:hypothetical protein